MKKLYIVILLASILNILNAQPKGQQAIFNATSNSYIDYGKGLNLNGYSALSNGTSMTIAMWVKWDDKLAAGVGEWANLFTLNDTTSSGDNGVFWVQHNQNNSKFEFALSTSAGRSVLTSTTTPQNGVWYHIACVFNSTLSKDNMKLYINGILESKSTLKNKIITFGRKTKLNMGRWANPSNNYRNFNGMIDEVSVWSKDLTVTQINNLMANPESVTGISYNASKLIGYYNFDNANANDLTPMGNNGTNAGSVTFTNIGSLPVELINFDVAHVNGKSVIQWSTATETNNNYFTIERSIDGVNAEVIGVVKGAGNSNSIIDYKFQDNQPLSGIVYYRIKQTDFDGTTETFDWKSVKIDQAVESEYSVYPNPTNGNINISLSNIQSSTSSIKVIDITGRVIYASNTESENSFNTTFDLPSDSPSGIYFVEVVNANNRYVEKIVLK